MTDVKIVALVPTRGDRQTLLANMHNMMSRQTKQLYGMVVVDDTPLNPDQKDITYRYQTGLTRVFEQYPDCDVVALIEDDDWYSPQYLEKMSAAWVQAGRPHTFGQGETHYYHLGLKSMHYQKHPERSSAFTTFMSRELLKMNWPKDDYSFVDIDIWKQFPGKTICFDSPVAVGIKGYKEGAHFGGIGHNDRWAGYHKGSDHNLNWLMSTIGTVDPDSFKFYKQISDRVCRG